MKSVIKLFIRTDLFIFTTRTDIMKNKDLK